MHENILLNKFKRFNYHIFLQRKFLVGQLNNYYLLQLLYLRTPTLLAAQLFLGFIRLIILKINKYVLYPSKFLVGLLSHPFGHESLMSFHCWAFRIIPQLSHALRSF